MTNLSILNNQPLTMSSREIAKLTSKRHDNVKRDIAAMLASLEKDTLSFEGIYLDTMKRQQTEYHLDKELTICLIAGYSAALRMAIIKRWQELEEKLQKKNHFSLSRRDAKELSLPMRNALKDVRAIEGKETLPHHYSNEFDMINRIVLGYPAKRYKQEHGLDTNANLRDTLTTAELKAIADLEDVNRALIDLGFSFDDRKEKLKQLFDRKHKLQVIDAIVLINE